MANSPTNTERSKPSYCLHTGCTEVVGYNRFHCNEHIPEWLKKLLPCEAVGRPHQWLIGNLTLSLDMPELFNELGPAPLGYEWHVCKKCGLVKGPVESETGRMFKLAHPHNKGGRPKSTPTIKGKAA